MTARERVRRRGAARRRPAESGEPAQEQGGGIAAWFLGALALIACACLVAGCVRHGFAWKSVLAAAASLAAGIGFVAIGLLELEWLERVIGFVDGIFAGLWQWCWTSWHGTLSDNELIGRRGAQVIWVVLGVPVFAWGCLMALRIVNV